MRRCSSRQAASGPRLLLSLGVLVGACTTVEKIDKEPPVTPLAGTSWQWVGFEGGDGARLTPDDKTRYTVAFNSGGEVAVRFDCNRGRGTWQSSGPNQLEFGPLALTRAMCPPGSMHDRLVRQWPYVRSYVLKDGQLFLSLQADGGVLEFEPAGADQP